MPAKLATLGLLKIKFRNKDYDLIFFVYDVTRKILSSESNYIDHVVMWPKFVNNSIFMRQVIITSILKEFHPKNHFFEGYPWFKFNYLRLALGMGFKFSISMIKSLKLKVRKLLGLIPTFAEVTWEKLIREGEILLHILNSVESIRRYGMLKKNQNLKVLRMFYQKYF